MTHLRSIFFTMDRRQFGNSRGDEEDRRGRRPIEERKEHCLQRWTPNHNSSVSLSRECGKLLSGGRGNIRQKRQKKEVLMQG